LGERAPTGITVVRIGENPPIGYTLLHISFSRGCCDDPSRLSIRVFAGECVRAGGGTSGRTDGRASEHAPQRVLVRRSARSSVRASERARRETRAMLIRGMVQAARDRVDRGVRLGLRAPGVGGADEAVAWCVEIGSPVDAIVCAWCYAQVGRETSASAV